uniref:Tyrosine-protein phosphatase domain-containing protein n=1 Tax=Steinernema glaseri TaxID=37863 RepID=A0A1I7YII2_9BILA
MSPMCSWRSGSVANCRVFDAASSEEKPPRQIPSGLAAAAGRDNAVDFSIPAVFLVAISALTLVSVLTLAVVIVCYNRTATKRGSATSSTSTTNIVEDNEPSSSTWDSLSFNHSRNDLTNLNNEMWESTSDESYLNSLDEVVSQRASIIHPHTRYVDTVSGRISHCRSYRSSIPSVFTETTSVGGGTEYERKGSPY